MNVFIIKLQLKYQYDLKVSSKTKTLVALSNSHNFQYSIVDFFYCDLDIIWDASDFLLPFQYGLSIREKKQ